jgi:hypothetical protein
MKGSITKPPSGMRRRAYGWWVYVLLSILVLLVAWRILVKIATGNVLELWCSLLDTHSTMVFFFFLLLLFIWIFAPLQHNRTVWAVL